MTERMSRKARQQDCADQATKIKGPRNRDRNDVTT